MDCHVIRTVTHGDQVAVSLEGEIDLAAAAALREAFAVLIDAGRTDLVADLRGVTFIDSTGFGTLVSAHKATRQQGGRLQLVVPERGPVARILRLSALDRVFTVHDDLAAALRRPSVTTYLS